MDPHVIITEPVSNLRALGRRILVGNWKTAALVSFLFLLLTVVPQLLISELLGVGLTDAVQDPLAVQEGNPIEDALSNLYMLLVYGPLYLGYVGIVKCITRRQETNVGRLFDGFEMFLKAFSLHFMMTVFITLWSLLLLIPGIIASYRYSLAFYLLMDDPEIGILEAIGKSKELMRGNKWKMFCLDLSFFGWAFLAILTCGVGFIWLLPYTEASRFAFYEILVGNLKVRYRYVETEICEDQQPDGGMGYQEEPQRESDEQK